VPPDFPEQYRDAVARAAAACNVETALLDPPELRVTTTVHAGRAA
jgi:hypothetical protein